MDTHPRIWAAVRRIPRGSVATYGDVARACSLTGQARLVGYALHNLPAGAEIPWHRVVNARGKISLKGDAGKTQRRLLEAEGVTFEGERIDLERYRQTRSRTPRTRRRRRTHAGHGLSGRAGQ